MDGFIQILLYDTATFIDRQLSLTLAIAFLRTIYEKLGSALNEDQRVLYQQRVEDLTPNLRYCAYNIGDKSAMSDLKKLRREGKSGMDNLDVS